MRTFPLRTASWLALVGAIVLWGATGFFSSVVSREETARSARILEQQDASLREASVVKLRTIARNTKDQRAALESLTNANVDNILDQIEVISRETGVKLEISQAFSESETKRPLRTINFIVSANGTFERLTNAAALLELFPVPSVIDQVRIERDEANKSGWNLEIRMRVFTSRDPSL